MTRYWAWLIVLPIAVGLVLVAYLWSRATEPEPVSHGTDTHEMQVATHDFTEFVKTEKAKLDVFYADQARRVRAASAARRARSAPTPRSGTVTVYAGGVWDALQRCECPPGWHCNTGNSYYGGLQANMQFWHTYDGTQFAARPDLATREQQITVATRARDGYKGYRARGYHPWPTCGRRLGLIA